MRFRATRPATAIAPPPADDVELTLFDRRARAFRRVFPLLSTSVPTADIVESYLAEVLGP